MAHGIDEWYPKDIGWWLEATQGWKLEWLGAVDLVLCFLWQEAFKVREEDQRLPNVAHLTPKAWKALRAGVGGFFLVRDGLLIQENLFARFEESMDRHLKLSTRNSGNVKKSWEKRRNRKLIEDVIWQGPESTSGNTNRNTTGITNGKASGIEIGLPVVIPQVPISRDLLSSSDHKEERREYASAVPKEAVNALVTEVLRVYPKSRHVGEADRELIAAFIEKNPNYPILPAVKQLAKQEFPPGLVNFLANPTALEVVMANIGRSAAVTPPKPMAPATAEEAAAGMAQVFAAAKGQRSAHAA